MKDLFSNVLSKAQNAIKYWWTLLVAGVLLIALGIVVFFYPSSSYITMAWLFGIIMLVTGVAQLCLVAGRNYFTDRVWMILGAILDVALGAILCCNIGITAVILPFLLGFWIMCQGFILISIGNELDNFRVQGSGWCIAEGILLIILSVLMLFHPVFGSMVLVILLGVALMMVGISFCDLAFRLKNIHKSVKKAIGK